MRSRIRQIHPEFFKHEALAALEFSTRTSENPAGLPLRIAFAGLWCVADRRGLFPWKHRALKREILPDDTLDFESVLTALESGGFVRRYTVADETYGQIPKFAKWQHFHKREKPHPHIPDPDTGQTNGLARGQHRVSTPASASASASASAYPLMGPLDREQPKRARRRPSSRPDSRDTYVDRVIRGEA